MTIIDRLAVTLGIIIHDSVLYAHARYCVGCGRWVVKTPVRLMSIPAEAARD